MHFFFFQAEDGIRDWSVTGVQTCALPISTSRERYEKESPAAYAILQGSNMHRKLSTSFAARVMILMVLRSEERRVGKSVDLEDRRDIKKMNRSSKRTREVTDVRSPII